MKVMLKRTLKYLLVILAVCGVLSTLAYFAFNDDEDPFTRIALNWSFVLIMAFFCYALLAFVTEQGLFNGFRYSTKHVRATLSKGHRRLMMDEFEVNSETELKEVIKEKYLYTRPKFRSTYPLLISSTVLFIVVSVLSFTAL